MAAVLILGGVLIALGVYLILANSLNELGSVKILGFSINVPTSFLVLLLGVVLFAWPFTDWWPDEVVDIPTTTVASATELSTTAPGATGPAASTAVTAATAEPTNPPTTTIATIADATTTTTTTTTTLLSSCLHVPIETGDFAGEASLDAIEDGAVMSGDSIDPLVGTWRDVPDDIEIWILVSPFGTDRFYQQSHRVRDPAERLSDGRFVAAAFMGEDGRFEVLAVLASRAASEFLGSTLERWEAAGDFPGLSREELPPGLLEADCRTVIFSN